jgi:hypothetical protein
MSDGATGRSEMDQWCGLIEETRRALATLRADDLERLAARAERIAEVNGRLGRPERLLVARQSRLLHEQLLATCRNINILVMRNRGRHGRGDGTEGNLPWER